MAASSFAELSGLLLRERDVLDLLVSHLKGGDGPGGRDHQVERDGLLRSISSLELHRAITAREIAMELGFVGEPTLQDLIERSDGEWAAVLASHRQALQALSAEVRSLLRAPPVHVDANVVLLGTGQRQAQRSLHDFLA